jgi:hypothetical protein
MKRIMMSAIFATIIGGVALAGEKQSVPVQVNLKEQWAGGAMGSAHNSMDHVQYIGCSIAAYASGTESGYMTCFASSATGLTATCTLANPNSAMVGALSTISDTSIIKFAWDASNRCTELYVTASSTHEPKR